MALIAICTKHIHTPATSGLICCGISFWLPFIYLFRVWWWDWARDGPTFALAFHPGSPGISGVLWIPPARCALISASYGRKCPAQMSISPRWVRVVFFREPQKMDENIRAPSCLVTAVLLRAVPSLSVSDRGWLGRGLDVRALQDLMM